MPHLWQGQSEIILKIYKNNFFSRKGHSAKLPAIKQQLLSALTFGHLWVWEEQ